MKLRVQGDKRKREFGNILALMEITRQKKPDTYPLQYRRYAGPQFFGWLTAMGRDVTDREAKEDSGSLYRDYLKLLAKE